MNRFPISPVVVVVLLCLAVELASAGWLDSILKGPKNVDSKKKKESINVIEKQHNYNNQTGIDNVDWRSTEGQKKRKKKDRKVEADFDALSAHLLGQLEVADFEANMKLIKRDVAQLRGGARRAAELLIQLASSPLESCDDQLLVVLRKADKAGLRSYHCTRRTDQLIGGHLQRALESCEAYIQHTLVQAVAADGPLARLAQVLQPKTDPGSYSTLNRPRWGELNHFLSWLIKDYPADRYTEFVRDNKSGVIKSTRNKQKFMAAFNRHLLWPCQRWLATLGHLFEAATSVANIQNEMFLFNERVEFRYLAWTNNVCQFVGKMNEKDMVAMLREDKN